MNALGSRGVFRRLAAFPLDFVLGMNGPDYGEPKRFTSGDRDKKIAAPRGAERRFVRGSEGGPALVLLGAGAEKNQEKAKNSHQNPGAAFAKVAIGCPIMGKC